MRCVPPFLLVAMLALAPLGALAATVSATQGASTYEASSARAPAVRDLAPLPGTTVKAFFPRLAARFETHGAQLRTGSLRLYVDGRDVSATATLNGDTVAYVPREHLRAGWHDVFLEGADTANDTFGQAWVFRSQNPDIDVPMEDEQFAFVPVGMHGRFSHFFLISPFDGFGVLQFCNFTIPLHRAGAAPVFFVTVPFTLGTALLGCNPRLAFTPFQAGIGVLNPIFFQIEIAGPGIFQGGGGDHHRRHPLIGGTPATPVYRTTTVPIFRTTIGAPVFGAPVRGAALPTVSVPQPSIPQPYIPH